MTGFISTEILENGTGTKQGRTFVYNNDEVYTVSHRIARPGGWGHFVLLAGEITDSIEWECFDVADDYRGVSLSYDPYDRIIWPSVNLLNPLIIPKTNINAGEIFHLVLDRWFANGYFADQLGCTWFPSTTKVLSVNFNKFETELLNERTVDEAIKATWSYRTFSKYFPKIFEASLHFAKDDKDQQLDLNSRIGTDIRIVRPTCVKVRLNKPD